MHFKCAFANTLCILLISFIFNFKFMFCTCIIVVDLIFVDFRFYSFHIEISKICIKMWVPSLCYPLANEVARGYTCSEHSRINILQWILTKLCTYLVLKRIWNPIDFQGHRSKVKVTGSNFYRITSLWTLESTSFNVFWPSLVHT